MLKMAKNGWNCWKWLKTLKMLEDNFRKLARNLEISSYKVIRKKAIIFSWKCWKCPKMAETAENGWKRWKWLKMLEDNFRKLARNLEINSYKEIRKEKGGDLPDNLVWNNHATSQNMTLPDKKGQPGQASLERSASLRSSLQWNLQRPIL